ncbi:hypothetical protein EVAR_10446_1 [Eumeta japonica]|uniref:Uncharacterized protein n=1 Tax=Eumeta variegata TaxID=151549 RepID=A0A4C1THB5_EUMVA|nr:hypothetical protein EVAR_10446_1 [Eumeta japonica]
MIPSHLVPMVTFVPYQAFRASSEGLSCAKIASSRSSHEHFSSPAVVIQFINDLAAHCHLNSWNLRATLLCVHTSINFSEVASVILEDATDGGRQERYTILLHT